MKLKEILSSSVKEKLNEQNQKGKIIAYHGSSSAIPFETFDQSMIGSGIVSTNKKFNGFFFTTEKENAEFYTEYFVCKVMIDNVKETSLRSKNPNDVLNLAFNNKENYIIKDIFDGATFSDIVVVPKNNLSTIKIIKWYFVGDEESIFEKWDSIFGGEEGFVNNDMIRETIEILDIDFNELIKIPIFKKYYLSKK